MELLERERYLADLTAWFGAVPERGGCIALVRGEAGIGKTVLLQKFSEQQRDARVLWGACDALFTPRPLAPLHDIARQAQGSLLTAMSSGANRDAIFAAALDELEGARALVVFEDMHWADEATLDLLKYLGRRIHRTRVMLAVTYRDDEVGPRHPLRFVIGDLPRAHTFQMPLSPLSEPAVAQLATRAGRPSKGLHGITGGNPLFVTEVLAGATDTVPVTVRDAVLARAARLSPAAREIAELVCVVPGKAETWLLEQAAQPDDAGVEGCLSIGMVRTEDGALAFRHEIVRRALEDSLSRARQQSLHARVLSILAPRPGLAAARLAHHANGAGNDTEVLRYAPVAAAQAASVGAHREAAAHYHAALRHAESLAADERVHLEELLSYECHLTGQHERAIEFQRSALTFWRASGQRVKEGNALRWLSWLSWFAGNGAAANQYASEAINILESLTPGPELAMAYCIRADLDMEAHEANSAVEWAERAIALAEPWAHAGILSQAFNIRGTVRLIGGDTSGWADLDRSMQLALDGGIPERIAGTHTNLAAMAVSSRRYEQASRYLGQGMAYCEEHDLDSWWLYMLAYRARMRFEQGHWNAAGDDVQAVLKHPRTTSISRIPALRILGHLRVRRGDPDANSPLEEARALGGPAPELQRVGTLAAIHAEAAWLRDDREGVRRAAQPAYELLRSRRDPRMKGELAAWLWRTGLRDPDATTDIPESYALEISGDWRGAANAWQALGCPYEHACMLAWYGAEPEQRQAFAIFEQLGAAPAALALRKQMRALGVRSVPRGARTSTLRHPHGLTRRETEILALLSDGLRNAVIARRLFISTKTVDHHVSAILAKLGVPSRAEAIAMARRQPGAAE
ncbi:MAG TPA: LuxR C-terminal-related transcriptional regulator [Steroidobacteraceae bacterium]|jgi:DNA-binding CsgD family transcriptional regulator|nr:LuxR C-terminal-related transcriptional regulator [Steroidobacteraceae bacterium]